MKSPQEKLGLLREKIAEVDRSLLELLERRMNLAAEVGRHKAASDSAVVVREIEERVLSRARQHAERCGISEGVMESIFSSIIRGSVERQHRVGVNSRVARGGDVLILGGAGGMGTWFRDFLTLVGHPVAAVDPAFANLPASEGRFSDLAEVEDLDRYEAIIVAVPLVHCAAAIEQIRSRRPKALVVEIASIKTQLDRQLRLAEDAGIEVCALHPMFGPGKSPYEPLTFVLACRRDAGVESKRVETLLRHPYTRLITIPFDEHDRLMGWLLGLAHLNGMLFGAALTRSELAPRDLRACASTTFSRQAASALSILSEDPDLYLDIQRLNPHRDEVYVAAREALEELIGLVDANDREGFRRTLNRARERLIDE